MIPKSAYIVPGPTAPQVPNVTSAAKPAIATQSLPRIGQPKPKLTPPQQAAQALSGGARPATKTARMIPITAFDCRTPAGRAEQEKLAEIHLRKAPNHSLKGRTTKKLMPVQTTQQKKVRKEKTSPAIPAE